MDAWKVISTVSLVTLVALSVIAGALVLSYSSQASQWRSNYLESERELSTLSNRLREVEASWEVKWEENEREISSIRKEQEEISSRVDELDSELSNISQRISEIDERLSDVESKLRRYDDLDYYSSKKHYTEKRTVVEEKEPCFPSPSECWTSCDPITRCSYRLIDACPEYCLEECYCILSAGSDCPDYCWEDCPEYCVSVRTDQYYPKYCISRSEARQKAVRWLREHYGLRDVLYYRTYVEKCNGNCCGFLVRITGVCDARYPSTRCVFRVYLDPWGNVEDVIWSIDYYTDWKYWDMEDHGGGWDP